jgi:hypothetical protein
MSSDVLELEARLKDYITGDMNNIINAMDKFGTAAKDTKKPVNDLEQSTNQLKDSWNVAKIAVGSLVSAMGAMAIFNKVTEFVKMGRVEMKDWIVTNAQMKASLGYVSLALNEQAAILGKKLTMDAEEIKKIQTSISYFTKDETAIKQLTEAALNFSAATGGSGMSVARALEGSSRELQRYGIHIEGTIGSSERWQEIVTKINKKFPEQATAVSMAKDWWDRLSLSIRNASESFMLINFQSTNADVIYQQAKKTIDLVESNKGKSVWKRMPVSIEDEKKAREFINKYELEQNKKKNQTKLEEDAEAAKKSIELTLSLRKELWGKTESGKIKVLQLDMENELKNTLLTEEQKHLIRLRYEMDISAIRKKASDDELKATQDRIAAMDKMLPNRTTMEEGQEAEKKAEKKRIDDLIKEENRLAGIRQGIAGREYKQKQTDRELEKKKSAEKLESLGSQTDYALNSLSLVARASKASSGVQKGIDIAQATAATALAVTKSLATPWMIPFIVATGMAQVALITQQKYAGGGLVGGGSPLRGDVVPSLLTPGEMVLNGQQQSNLFNMIQRPNVSNSNSINLNISVGAGGTYDMNAARYTADQLVPIIGDALVRAKSQGRLRDYEAAR